MTTIGIYDSGIGGLTTAKEILNLFCGNDVYYFADNKNMPYGQKSNENLKGIIYSNIKKLKCHCDICVVACNTASTLYDENDVIKLLPPIQNKLLYINDEKPLLLATPRTICFMQNSDKFQIADTAELAQLIEIQANLKKYDINKIDMSVLQTYIKIQLKKFSGVKNVVLGCSHYPYCKPQISNVLGNVEYFDGNNDVIKQLAEYTSSIPNRPSKIEFAFSGQSERKKYQNILSALLLN